MMPKRTLKQCLKQNLVLILVCLMMLLSGCGQSVVTKIEPQYPPQAYLTMCKQSVFKGNTYGDTISFLITVIEERDICANQIKLINEWIDNASKNTKSL
ncbi:Rz1-like lysis system protein LysC [Phocoenobacter uteri]|uniref:Rz1-like lysis system protein LysC n=1 Tax=Phocoenobacter uteri TaxID=146806 RepID=UPI003C71396B